MCRSAVRCIALMPSYGCQPAISHALPVSACRSLGSDRRYSAVFELVSIRAAGELHAKFGWRWCQRRPLRPSAPRASIGALARCPAFRSLRCRARALRSLRHPPYRWRWWFCSIRGWLSACHRRVVVLMTPFPPFGDGEITVRGCVVPKVQTTSVKNAENGVLWARWSAFWAQWCQSWWPCWQPGPSAGSINPSMRS